MYVYFTYSELNFDFLNKQNYVHESKFEKIEIVTIMEHSQGNGGFCF